MGNIVHNVVNIVHNVGNLFEFYLNDFLWIQRIQWIMTKSKSSMVTRGISHLATYTLPVLVIESVFSLLSWGRYLLPLTTLNRYQPTDSSRKFVFTTLSSNVSIVRYRMSLVTILPLDLVMIHWIPWIQGKSLRENSIIHDLFKVIMNGTVNGINGTMNNRNGNDPVEVKQLCS